MIRNMLIAILVYFGACTNAPTAFATTVDFESLSHSGSGTITVPVPYLEDSYYVYGADHPVSAWGTASPNFAGSTGLFMDTGTAVAGSNFLILASPTAPLFDLISIDFSPIAADGNNTNPNRRLRVILEGVFADAGSVSQTIDVPWFFGFRTFYLTGFTNLRWVNLYGPLNFQRFAYSDFQFDNVVIVPEPWAMLTLATGIVLSSCIRFRRNLGAASRV